MTRTPIGHGWHRDDETGQEIPEWVAEDDPHPFASSPRHPLAEHPYAEEQIDAHYEDLDDGLSVPEDIARLLLLGLIIAMAFSGVALTLIALSKL